MRVATFNILHGHSPDDDRVDVGRFAAAIRTLDADVLALQEVDRSQPRSLGADLTSIAAEAMGADEHRFVAALAGTPGVTWEAATGDEPPGTAAYGIALLSRYPVAGWEVLRLPALRMPVPMRHDRGRPHLVRDEARVAVMARVRSPSGDVLVATTHLSFLPGWNVVQLRRVTRALGSQPGPAILMGDLNMEPRLAERARECSRWPLGQRSPLTGRCASSTTCWLGALPGLGSARRFDYRCRTIWRWPSTSHLLLVDQQTCWRFGRCSVGSPDMAMVMYVMARRVRGGLTPPAVARSETAPSEPSELGLASA